MRPEAAGGKFRCQATLERELRARGFHAVAGVDEVGRGCLFGPVVAGAVILSPDRPVRGLNDSKLLEPERREVLAERIRERAVAWAVAAVDAATIDWINIYQASILAMRKAIDKLTLPPAIVLADGNSFKHEALRFQNVIDGDAKSMTIAAASIVAKVTRDSLMREYHAQFPEYGFDRHKGYGTRLHIAALHQHGLCPIHRRTFHIPDSKEASNRGHSMS